jgi:hypothetical protein
MMLNTLINTLDYCLNGCKNANDQCLREIYFCQAFGAVQYHIFMFPNDEKKVENLWDVYKPQFEAEIYK